MVALAASSDLTRFGYIVPAGADNLLDRASTRIRLAAGHQTITADTSTVTFPGPVEKLHLWQMPVTGVTSVTLEDSTVIDDYKLVGNDLFLPRRFAWAERFGFADDRFMQDMTVVYTHGYATIPDALIELTCSVAMRLSGTKPDRDPAIQAQTVGDVSQTFNPMFTNVPGLLPAEEAVVRRFFYYRG